ncbi:DUF5703 family protein, partial [Streptomyces sp. NPDC006307]|uniref:DUF5703 family protein n=1 Tax=Streptomyces sp. NPDC006307 TaxID=3156748 RepID=UPI0033A70293
MPEYEFVDVYVPRGVSRKEATRLLTDHAEYGHFTNELLLGRVLKERRADAFVSTKCGLLVG